MALPAPFSSVEGTEIERICLTSEHVESENRNRIMSAMRLPGVKGKRDELLF